MTQLVPLSEPDEHAALRAAVAAIVGKFGHDLYQRCAADGEPMRELWDLLGAQGFLGLAVPQEYGGGGAGLTELAIVEEEMAAGGCPDMVFVVSQGLAVPILARHGTAAQRERYLPGLATGRERFVFALTEPDAGSNTHNLSTVARRDGDEWVIRGTKYYISGIDQCDHFLLVARTGTDGPTGRGKPSVFIVDDPTVAGLTWQPIPTSLRAPDRQFTVFFDDVRLPIDSVVGEVDNGLHVLFDGLNPERVLSAAISTGIARYALDKAVDYARSRVVWQAPIGTHQAVAHPLADAAVELAAARLMMWRAAALFDHGLPAGEEANMAKLLASRVGMQALDTAIQTHGGNGLAEEYGLADLWGMARLLQVGPVSTQMVLNFVAQHTLGLPRSY